MGNRVNIRGLADYTQIGLVALLSLGANQG